MGSFLTPQAGAQIQSGLGDIAKAFAPPSISDMYVASKMIADRANADRKDAAIAAIRATNPRLADYFSTGVTDPVGQYTKQDIYSVAAQPGATPQSLDTRSYAIHGNAENTFTGQAIKNANDIQKTKLTQSGETTRALLSPVAANSTRFVPKGVAGMYDIPEVQSGAVNVGANNNVYVPGADGTVDREKPLSGPETPDTLEQAKAKDYAGLSPELRNAIVFGNTPVESVIRNGKPVVVTRAGAIGQQPYAAPSSPGSGQVLNWQSGDGKASGTAILDPVSNKLIDTQTGQELPAGSRTQDKGGTIINNIPAQAPNAIEKAYGEGVGTGINDIQTAANAAPQTLSQIAQIRDAVARSGGNITTGPLGGLVLKGKQAIGGALGIQIPGTSEAEVINNVGFGLATQAARSISSRPTQFEFGKALETKPGLALSPEGMNALLNIKEQEAHDAVALNALLQDPANRQNWEQVKRNYYATHPIMSPFDPKRPLDGSDIQTLSDAAARNGTTPASIRTAPSLAVGGSANVNGITVRRVK